MGDLPSIHDLLEPAENGGANDPVVCAKLNLGEARHSRQLKTCWFSWSLDAHWTKFKVQVKEKGQLYGEPCTWEPRSRSQFAGMLLSILSCRFAGDMLRRQSKPSSDVFVNTSFKAGIVVHPLRSRRYATTSSCTAHDLTLTRSSSKRSSALPEPRALSARPQPAAQWKLMLFVVRKERAKARQKARKTARVETKLFPSNPACDRASSCCVA